MHRGLGRRQRGDRVPTPGDDVAADPVPGSKLDHLIFIVQENRSFDHYFGTYPGADGIPTKPDGSFAVCVPDPWQGGTCVPPYVAHKIDFDGGPHDEPAAIKDVDGGKMDGFVGSLDARPTKCWVDRTLPHCDRILGPQGQPDVMSTLAPRFDPELLELGRSLRPAGRDVHAGRLVEPPLAPVPDLGVVGLLLQIRRTRCRAGRT